VQVKVAKETMQPAQYNSGGDVATAYLLSYVIFKKVSQQKAAKSVKQ
jgi:hypothetical protein